MKLINAKYQTTAKHVLEKMPYRRGLYVRLLCREKISKSIIARVIAETVDETGV